MILITGATGFLGRALIKRLNGMSQIRVVARNEGKLINLKQDYPEIEIITGDISDECTCEIACKDVDIIYHLAAFKHVGLAETRTYQCARSNIVGTINLLKYFNGNLFVAISTDKAAHLQGVYGASKYIMESLIKEWSKVRPGIKYIVPRYGNVLGSTGSIVPKWIDLAKKNGSITITDPDATRFFFSVEDAVDLIFEAVENGTSGEVYIKKMKSCTVMDIANAIQKKYGNFKNINYIGLQKGENRHEYLTDDFCSLDAERWTVDELVEMI